MGGLKYLNKIRYYLLVSLVATYPLSVLGVHIYLKQKTFGSYYLHLVLINTLTSILLAVFLSRRRVRLTYFLSRVFTGGMSSVLGIYTLIVFIITVASWTPDYLREFIDEYEWIYLMMALTHLTTGINTSLLFMLSQMMKPLNSKAQYTEPLKKRVLFVALSKFDPKRRDELIEYIEKRKLSESKINWAVPLRSVEHHIPKLERLVVLVSTQSHGQYPLFEELWAIFKRHYNADKVEIMKSNPINFNDLKECQYEIHRLLRSGGLSKYRDEDISMNITGGTAIVSAAMVIASVKEGRQIEYVEQTEGGRSRLLGLDVSMQDIQLFSPEEAG
ncbi:hypothetical protein [Hydrogenivirga sp.]